MGLLNVRQAEAVRGCIFAALCVLIILLGIVAVGSFLLLLGTAVTRDSSKDTVTLCDMTAELRIVYDTRFQEEPTICTIGKGERDMLPEESCKVKQALCAHLSKESGVGEALRISKKNHE